ncbi:MAG: hypothetical protein ACR2L3_02965 [Actinomycetota bacterium]
MRRHLIALALPLALFASSAQGAPMQMDPEVEPTITGPLSPSSDAFVTGATPRCDRQTTKVEGQTVGVTRICFSLYRFDPTQETDADRDYGVWWIQATLTPKNGWCANRLIAKLDLESNQAHAFTGKDFGVGNSKDVAAFLRVDADGHASSVGTVKKRFTIHPRTITGSFSATGNTLKLVWRGATKSKTVALAGGVEGSWAPEAGPGSFVSQAIPRLISTC